MIEAVNSSIANAQVLRGNAGSSNVSSVAVVAVPVAVEKVTQAPKAPYISPYISIDVTHNKAVLQIRDSDTGDVKQQFPTKSRLAQLSQLQAKHENAQRVSRVDAPVSEVKYDSVGGSAGSNYEAVSTDIITVQDVTSSAPSNVSLPSPEVAAAALSAGAQSAQAAPSTGVSVLA